MKLHYRELGSGQPMVILHGLFGFSDNWQTHAKRLAEYFRVILVDLRNHGHSEWSDDFSYSLMAADLKELCEDLNLASIVLMGHSMGGKTAMLFAQQHPDLVEKLIVVDMGVKEYPPHHQQILEALNSLNLDQISFRSEAEKHLSKYIDSEGVKQFLLKNIYWEAKGKLAWRMNIDVLQREMPEILKKLPFIQETFVPTLFIRGESSGYVLDEDVVELEKYFPDSDLITIEGAGHWVHAEAPDAFLDAVLNFCLR